jgi:hypothetical protein
MGEKLGKKENHHYTTRRRMKRERERDRENKKEMEEKRGTRWRTTQELERQVVRVVSIYKHMETKK